MPNTNKGLQYGLSNGLPRSVPGIYFPTFNLQLPRRCNGDNEEEILIDFAAFQIARATAPHAEKFKSVYFLSYRCRYIHRIVFLRDESTKFAFHVCLACEKQSFELLQFVVIMSGRSANRIPGKRLISQ